MTNEYPSVIRKIVNKFSLKYREDFLNELFIKHFELQEKFDPNYGTTFEQYAYKELYFTASSYVKEQNSYALTLDNNVPNSDLRYCDLLPDTEELNRHMSFCINSQIECLKSTLTQRELDVFNLKIKGESKQSIAFILNIDVKTVYNTLKRIENKEEHLRK